jgi:HAD superfamily hydrolase (TIGR01509 family)
VRDTGALRAVLFDMDGLLVDSEPLWYEAECVVMSRLGAPWGRADQMELIGSSLAEGVAIMLAKAPHPADPGLVGRWLVDAMTQMVVSRGVELLPGAGRLLAELAAAAVPCALVTSAQRQIMDAVIAVTGLSFGVTVCGEDVRRSKPDPEPYLRAVQLLGADPACCVVLEDSPRGITAAQAAGCPVIAVPSVPLPAGLAGPVAPRHPGQPGRMIVASLHEVDLARIHQIVRLSCTDGLTGENSPSPGLL